VSPDEKNSDFEELLLYLRQARGFDFTGYKRSTLMRRVSRRMSQVDIEAFPDYLDFLQVHPDEFEPLFNTILINVTSFFRDPEAWSFLSSQIIPGILQRTAGEGATVRCWCAGVASGDEAYSLAMLLAEAIGPDDFRRRVKIYATDVDEGALAEARLGVRSAKDLEAVPSELVDRYFEIGNGRRVFRSDLRRSLIFGRHDLVQDAPISRLDLLVCRNTLMYFTAETQSKVLARLHYALNDDGYLFLGKAEMLLTHPDLFSPMDLRNRVFTKVAKVDLRDRLGVFEAADLEAASHPGRRLRMLELISDSIPAAQVVVDAGGRITLINDLAREWLRLSARDVGRPLQDLEISYRPVELRSLIDQAYGQRQPVCVRDVEWHIPRTDVEFLDVHVTPLMENQDSPRGASIVLADVTGSHRLRDELERSRQELETAYEELQSTNEELETTNEELQSTVEELETTNEELQSSNEELETMNEELESTNGELQAINGELRRRTDEVEEVNSFMESVLASLQLGVVVLDHQLHVRMWYGRSDDLWGLRAAEVYDQPITGLDIGLPVEEVRTLALAALAGTDHGTQEAVIAATNRRGRTIRLRVVANQTAVSGGDGTGVVLLMEELR
jgi:two-component system, chemotaxis family, CheB/CheR fusion protein